MHCRYLLFCAALNNIPHGLGQHGGAVGNDAASKLQDPLLDPEPVFFMFSRFPDSHPPLKNMPVGGLATLDHP